MSLEDYLESLSEPQLQQLEYAFEQGVGQYVRCGDVLIGVYLHQLPGLEIIETEGDWGLAHESK